MGGLEPLKPDERITQRGYYFFVIRYNPDAFAGVHRDVFLKALRAEGIPAFAGYGVPVYKNPSYAQSGLPHPITPCPNAERACAKLKANLDELHKLAESAT